MAGIKSALKRVMDSKNEGVILAEGTLHKEPGLKCACGEKQACHLCSTTKFVIIRLKHDSGYITQYDSGSDIHIDQKLKVGDDTILMINDNWNATWELSNSKQPIEKTVND